MPVMIRKRSDLVSLENRPSVLVNYDELSVVREDSKIGETSLTSEVSGDFFTLNRGKSRSEK